MKLLNNQPEPGKITERKPFKNNTNFYVGKPKVIGGKVMIITAITYLTPKTVAVYGMDANQPMKLEEFKDFQRRRENGQLNIYLPGKKLFEIENV